MSADGFNTTLGVRNGTAAGKRHSCGELERNDTYLWGDYTARLQAARGLGVVSAFFTYIETEPDINQEIDIEFTGLDTTVMWASSWRDGRNFTEAVPLGFDAAAAPHDYGFSWRKSRLIWTVDGAEVLTLSNTSLIPRAVPAHLFVNTWLREPNEWVGEYDVREFVAPVNSSLAWVSFRA